MFTHLNNREIWNRELEEMEYEEHCELSRQLKLALMEEPFEKADAFRTHLQTQRTLGQVRALVEQKIAEHFGRDQALPKQDFVVDW